MVYAKWNQVHIERNIWKEKYGKWSDDGHSPSQMFYEI